MQRHEMPSVVVQQHYPSYEVFDSLHLEPRSINYINAVATFQWQQQLAIRLGALVVQYPTTGRGIQYALFSYDFLLSLPCYSRGSDIGHYHVCLSYP